MQVIPVLDIEGGAVVWGIRGRRHEYRPIVSRLIRSSLPCDVAKAFRDQLGLTELYLADLGAIIGSPPAFSVYSALRELGCTLWVDAGVRTTADAFSLAHAGIERIVLGLETIQGPQTLRECCQVLDPDRLVFSLDLKENRPLGDLSRWRSTDPRALADEAIAAGIRTVIVLDLARVGTGWGTGTEEFCARLAADHPRLELLAGGGVHNAQDLHRLEACGVRKVLVASALHDGRLRPDDWKAPGTTRLDQPRDVRTTQDGSIQAKDAIDERSANPGASAAPPIDHLPTPTGYDRWAAIYDDEDNPLLLMEEPRVAALVGEVSGLAVADIGCGTGRHAVTLAANGGHVTAVDFSDVMLQRAREKPGAERIRFVYHNLAHPLPLESAAFDRVLCCLVIDHIAHLDGLFGELRRICRADGCIVASVMHPAMMLRGIQARFTDPATGRETRPLSYAHQIADYVMAVTGAGLTFDHFSEHAVDDHVAQLSHRARKYLGWPLLLVMRLRPPDVKNRSHG
jgi:HisA/HisF family protein